MFAYKAHSPYEHEDQTSYEAGPPSVDTVREALDELQSLWTVALLMCDYLENAWTEIRSEVLEAEYHTESKWYRQAFEILREVVQPTLEGYELFEKHVGEFRSKLKILQDIIQIIYVNLSHIEQRQRKKVSSQLGNLNDLSWLIKKFPIRNAAALYETPDEAMEGEESKTFTHDERD